MGEKCLFRAQIFFQPLLAFPGKIAIPRQLGPLMGLPDIEQFPTCEIGAIKWNHGLKQAKNKTIFTNGNGSDV